MSIGAVVLAAGRSSRMGRPKALLPCRGATFLRTILATLEASGVTDMRIVLGDLADEVVRAESLAQDVVVLNPRYDDGMLSSVQAGIRALPPDLAGFLLWPVDHPLVTRATIERISLRFAAGGGIVLPTHDGRRGHPSLFASRMIPALLAAPAEVGARAVVHEQVSEVVEVAVDDPGVITDIDTPEAYRAALGPYPEL